LAADREVRRHFSSVKLVCLPNIVYLCRRNKSFYNMDRIAVIDRIKALAAKTLPVNSSLLLYGSRARGDYRADSDWDLLILLDKPKLVADDYDVTYPFRELGWEIGEDLNPSLYTKKQWNSWTYLPYYKNVERDKIIII
jgi:predicted nucleotidyltransferase